eukprot:5679076-Alexandrium_andersonii.AAC.1
MDSFHVCTVTSPVSAYGRAWMPQDVGSATICWQSRAVLVCLATAGYTCCATSAGGWCCDSRPSA